MVYKLQKASFTKRVSAMLFDFMMLIVVFLTCAFPLIALFRYNDYLDQREELQGSILEKWKIEELEEKYADYENVSFFEYEKSLTEEQKAALPEEVQIAFKGCKEELDTNEALANNLGTLVILFVTIFSLSLLLAFIILEFIVPLIFKNGQTFGKKYILPCGRACGFGEDLAIRAFRKNDPRKIHHLHHGSPHHLPHVLYSDVDRSHFLRVADTASAHRILLHLGNRRAYP